MERLQKVIAQSGCCSRRKAETLILEGKVKVNGKVVNTLGTRVSGNDTITVNNQKLEKEQKAYFVFYKPKGCITSTSDDKGRTSVMDYINEPYRLYPVGRLDYDTSGVLLLTNDGQFTNLMTHPRHQIEKTYEINLQGILSKDDIKAIRKGFTGAGMTFAPAKVYVRSTDPKLDRSLVTLVIHEGQNHEVKKMMEALGHEVRKLHRSKFSFLDLEGMRPGEYKRLKPYDVRMLEQQAREDNK